MTPMVLPNSSLAIRNASARSPVIGDYYPTVVEVFTRIVDKMDSKVHVRAFFLHLENFCKIRRECGLHQREPLPAFKEPAIINLHFRGESLYGSDIRLLIDVLLEISGIRHDQGGEILDFEDAAIRPENSLHHFLHVHPLVRGVL